MVSPIATFRKERDLSMEAFGKPFGVNKTTVLRWEDNGVSAERAVEIERAWGIPRHKLRPDIFKGAA